MSMREYYIMNIHFLSKRNNIFFLSVLIGVAVLAVPAALSAQWYNDGPLRSESRIPTPGLPIVPEYHSDMSLDCIVAYIAMDSLTHSVDRQYIRSFLRRTSIDTLRVMSRFM